VSEYSEIFIDYVGLSELSSAGQPSDATAPDPAATIDDVTQSLTAESGYKPYFVSFTADIPVGLR
jgi:hypothetical protein